MLENRCTVNAVIHESDHKGDCQNVREQQGEFEPIQCLLESGAIY